MSGALNHSPAQIIRELILDLSLGTSGSPWRVYYATLPDNPDKAIGILGSGGQHQGRDMVSGKVYERYGFQVTVRGDYLSAHNKANDIAVDFDQSVSHTIVEMDSRRYRILSISRTGSINPIGRDETSRRHLFTINATAAIRQIS